RNAWGEDQLVTTTDKKGVVTTYSYDTNGDMASASQDKGDYHVSDILYKLLNGEEIIDTITDRKGKVTTYEYDGNNLISTSSSDGSSAIYTQNEWGEDQLVTTTDKKGVVTTYSYDADGHMASASQDKGDYHVADMVYKLLNGEEVIDTITDRKGKVTTYEYDGNNLISTSSSDGSSAVYTQNAWGEDQLVTTTDKKGVVTTYTYDAEGYMSSASQDKDEYHVADILYKLLNGEEVINAITDRKGKVTTYEYDGNNLTSTSSSDGSSAVYTRNAWGEDQLVTTTDKKGIVTTYSYDTNGYMASASQDKDGKHIADIAYKLLNGEEVIDTITDRKGKVTTYEYDGNNLISTSSSDGSSAIYTQNAWGEDQLVTTTDKKGIVTTYSYDTDGYMASASQDKGDYHVANIVYKLLNGEEVIDTITDRKGKVTTYEYDGNNLISTSSSDGSSAVYTRNAWGEDQLVTTTDKKGIVTTYSYDTNGYMASASQDKDGKHIADIAYKLLNGEEVIDTITDRKGKVTTYEYDGNNLISTSSSDGSSAIYTQNAWGEDQLVTTTDKKGIVTTYSYDTDGYMASASQDKGDYHVANIVYKLLNGEEVIDTITDRKGKITTYEYDGNNLISTSSSDGSSAVYTRNAWGEDQLVTTTDKKGVVTTYAYDLNGYMASASQDKAGKHVGDITYKLLGGEEVIDTITDRKGKITTYEYDGNNLAATSSTDGSSAIYTQNEWGEDQLVTTTDKKGVVTTYTYDLNGYMASASQDKAGKHVGDITYKLLEGEEVIDTITDRKGKVTTYEYDGNNLISTSSSDGSSAVYTRNAWGEDQLVTTTDKKGVVTTYTYDTEGYMASASQDKNGNHIGDITYKLLNGEEVIDTITDRKGKVTTYEYDGNNLAGTSSSDGSSAVYTQNAWGEDQLVTTTDKKGVVTTYTYDLNGYMASASQDKDGKHIADMAYKLLNGEEVIDTITDRKGKETTYGYEGNNLVATSSTDGSSAVYTQNAWGEDQLVTTTDKKGVVTTYTYDAEGYMASASQDKNGKHIADMVYKLLNGEEVIDTITDRKGKVTTYEYDGNNLISTSSSDGSSAVYTQNAWGEDQLVTTTDKKGIVTTYSYDTDGYMASASQDKGDYHVANIVYKLLNGEEVIDTITDRKGKVTTYEYDGNNLISTSSSDGSSAVYTQNAWGEDQLVTTTDKKGVVTTYTYDAEGYMASASQDKNGKHIADMVYKLLNGEEVIDTITDRKGKVTTYEYDGNNLAGTSSTDGSSAVYTQNAWGEDQLVTTTDKKGVVTTYTYDAEGYMASASQDKNGKHIADMVYKLLNGEEVIDTITDRKGKITTYEYDGNNLAGTSSTDGSSAVYTQNAWGEDQLVTTTDKKGVVTTYSYDANGYMASASQDKDGKHIADMVYKLLNGEEVIDTITDRKGKVTTYMYDGNNLTATSSTDGSSATYSENAWGEDQLVTTTDKKGVVTTYTYDLNGYMASASQDKNGKHIADMAYKLLNGEEVIDTITDRKGKVTTYGYEGNNLVATSSTDGSSAVYTQNAWGEDQLVTTTDKKGVVTTYTYNAEGYMASASQDKGGKHIADMVYKLLNGEEVIDTITDRKGKVTTYGYEGNNLVATSSTDGSSAVYTQNAWGEDQLVTTTDKKGVVTTYTYNAEGYMASASQDKGGKHIADMVYKLLNGEEVIDTITDRKGKVTTYGYEGNNLVATSSTDGSSAVYTENAWGEDQLVTTTDKKGVVTTYSYDANGYMASASQDKDGKHVGDITYKLLGGEEVIDTITDRKGKVTTYEYDGNNLAATSSTDGSSAVYTRNAWGEDQLVTTTDKKGVVTTYTYDTEGYMASASQDKNGKHVGDITYKLLEGEEVIDTITDRKGKVTTYEYDGNNLAATSSTDGSSAVYTQNAWGEDQLVTTTDKKDVVTTYAYDADGYMASASQDKGDYHVADIVYKLLNGEEVIDTITDRKGKVTTYEYDGNNLAGTSSSDGSSAVYTENAWGEDQLVTTTDKKGVVTTYTYDTEGYMASASQDKDGKHVGDITYKLLEGEEVIDTITDRKGKITTYEYDGNNLAGTSSTDGSSAVYTQNAWGEDQLVTTTDKKGVVTTYSYDVNGYMSSASQDKADKHVADIAYKLLSGEEVIDTITDRKGKVTTYEYDGNNLAGTSSSDSSSAVYTQNAWGEDQLVTTTDKKGVVTTYSYDVNGYMSSASQDKEGKHIGDTVYRLLNGDEVIDTITDRKGKVTTYEYDGNNLISTSSSDGSSAVYTQNAWGEDQLVTTTDKKGVVTTYSYDANGYMSSASQDKEGKHIADMAYKLLNGEEVIDTITDRKGKVTTYEYDGNNLISTSSSDGSSAVYTQNAWGEDQLITATDKKGVVTTYSYDTNGYMSSASQDKEGKHIADMAYKLLNGEEVIDTITDRKGKVTTYMYDGNNLTATSSTDGSSATYSENAWGEDQLVTTTDKKGVVTTYTYDLNGYMTSSSQDKEGKHIADMAYKLLNGEEVIDTITDRKGKITTYMYDGNNLAGTSSTDGSRATYTQNAWGEDQLVTTTDKKGVVTTYVYDANGYMASASQDKGDYHVADMTYKLLNGEEVIDTITDRKGKVTTYIYEGNNLVATSSSDGSSAVYTQNAWGEDQLVTTTDKNGVVSTYSYDANGYMASASQDKNGKHVATMAYKLLNGEEVIDTITDRKGKITTYNYEGNNLVATSSTDGSSAVYTQNAWGEDQLVTTTDKKGVVTTYVYDANGYMTSASQDKNGKHVATMAYKLLNGEEVIDTITDRKGKITTYNYEGNNLVATSSTDGSSAVYTQNAWGEDQLVTTTDKNGVVTTYSYDANGYMSSASQDKNGKHVADMAYKLLNGEEVIDTITDRKEKVTTYVYEGNNLIATSSTDGSSAVYTQNAWGEDQLVTATDKKGVVTSYVYDANGYMASASQDKNGKHVADMAYKLLNGEEVIDTITDRKGKVTTYIYEGNNLVATSSSDGSSAVYTQNAWGEDQPVTTTDKKGVVTSYVYDANGYMASASQDKNGKHVADMVYKLLNGEEVIDTITDRKGKITTYEYDDNNNLLATSSNDGSSAVYAQNAWGEDQLVTTTDKKGVVTTYVYDANGYMASASQDKGDYHVADMTYKLLGGEEVIDTITDRKGKVTTYIYEGNNLAATSSTDGSSAVYVQNAWGEDQLVTTTDKKGVVTTYVYDANGYMASASQDKGDYHVANMTYKLLGGEEVIDTITDRKGKVTTYIYEGNNLAETSSTDGSSAVYVQNAWGEDQLVTTTDKKGVVTTYVYDANGYMASASQDKGDYHVADMTYKLLNGEEVIDTITDRKGKVTTYVYEGNNLVATSSTDGSSAVYTQNEWGEDQLVTSTDKKGVVTTYVYDANGYMASASQDKGDYHVADMTYKLLNGEEVIDRITDRKGKVTIYEYSGNNLSRTYVEGTSEEILYNLNAWGEDEIYRSTDKRGIVSTYTYGDVDIDGSGDIDAYDEYHRLTTVIQKKDDNIIATMSYKDLAGEDVVDHVTDRRGKITKYIYDTSGNLTRTYVEGTDEESLYRQNAWGEDEIYRSTDKKGVVTSYTYGTLSGVEGVIVSASQDKGGYHISDMSYALIAGEEVLDTITDRAGSISKYLYQNGLLVKVEQHRRGLETDVVTETNYSQNPFGEDYVTTSKYLPGAGKTSTYHYDANWDLSSLETRRSSDEKLLSWTYYALKGDVIDYMFEYTGEPGSETVRSSVYYFYGTDFVRASDSEGTLPIAVTNSYRGERTTQTISDVNDSSDRRSQTIFASPLGAGFEIADLTYSYNMDGETIRSTSFNYYDHSGSIVRATNALPHEAMARVESYKGDHVSDDTTLLQTQTIFYTGHGKGEEIADYTLYYSSAGLVSKKAVNFYGETKTRAASTGLATPIAQVNIYKNTKNITTAAYVDISELKSKTYYNIKNGADMRSPGEEYIDYVESYRANGTDVLSQSVYFYGDSLIRASDVAINVSARLSANVTLMEKLTKTQLHDTSDAGYFDYASLPDHRISNITFFKGDRQEEKSWYQLSYNESGENRGKEVRRTTVYFYGNSEQQAGGSSVNADTAMRSSISLDGDRSSDIGSINKNTSSGRRSKTFYAGDFAGDEIADYAWIFTASDGVNILHVNQYFYGDDLLAATDAIQGEDRMSKLTSRTSDGSKYGQYRVSETYYQGEAGFEMTDMVAQFSQYSNGTDYVVQTSIYIYFNDANFSGTYDTGEIHGKRAYQAEPDYIMEKVVNYQGDYTYFKSEKTDIEYDDEGRMTAFTESGYTIDGVYYTFRRSGITYGDPTSELVSGYTESGAMDQETYYHEFRNMQYDTQDRLVYSDRLEYEQPSIAGQVSEEDLDYAMRTISRTDYDTEPGRAIVTDTTYGISSQGTVSITESMMKYTLVGESRTAPSFEGSSTMNYHMVDEEGKSFNLRHLLTTYGWTDRDDQYNTCGDGFLLFDADPSPDATGWWDEIVNTVGDDGYITIVDTSMDLEYRISKASVDFMNVIEQSYDNSNNVIYQAVEYGTGEGADAVVNTSRVIENVYETPSPTARASTAEGYDLAALSGTQVLSERTITEYYGSAIIGDGADKGEVSDSAILKKRSFYDYKTTDIDNPDAAPLMVEHSSITEYLTTNAVESEETHDYTYQRYESGILPRYEVISDTVTKGDEIQEVYYVRDTNGNLIYTEKIVNGISDIEFNGINADIMDVLNDVASSQNVEMTNFTATDGKVSSYISSITDAFGNTTIYNVDEDNLSQSVIGMPKKFIAADGTVIATATIRSVTSGSDILYANFVYVIHDELTGKDHEFAISNPEEAVTCFQRYASFANTWRWDAAEGQRIYQGTDPELEGYRIQYRYDRPIAVVPPEAYAGSNPDDAMIFDGTDDYINCGYISEDLSKGFTMSGWLYYDSFANWSRIFDLGQGQADDNILLTNYGTSDDLYLDIYRGSGHTATSIPDVLETNTWMYITVTLDASGNLTVYKNGDAIYIGTTSLPNNVVRNSSFIGKSNWSGNAMFDGAMDDMALYSRALSQDEVREIMDTGAGSVSSGLILHYDFDDTSGNIARDVSGSTSTHNGTLLGSPSTLLVGNNILESGYTPLVLVTDTTSTQDDIGSIADEYNVDTFEITVDGIPITYSSGPLVDDTGKDVIIDNGYDLDIEFAALVEFTVKGYRFTTETDENGNNYITGVTHNGEDVLRGLSYDYMSMNKVNIPVTYISSTSTANNIILGGKEYSVSYNSSNNNRFTLTEVDNPGNVFWFDKNSTGYGAIVIDGNYYTGHFEDSNKKVWLTPRVVLPNGQVCDLKYYDYGDGNYETYRRLYYNDVNDPTGDTYFTESSTNPAKTGSARIESFGSDTNFIIGWTNETIYDDGKVRYMPQITVSLYGASLEFEDVRNDNVLGAATTSIFENADIARQLITATLMGQTDRRWDSETGRFSDTSGYMSYSVDFSDIDNLPVSMYITDAIGEQDLSNIANIERVQATDPSKTVIRISNNILGSTTYIVYNKDGQKEFLITISSGKSWSDYWSGSEGDISLSGADNVQETLRSRLLDGTYKVTTTPVSEGITKVEIYTIIEHDQGFKCITKELWQQGFEHTHVSMDIGGNPYSIGSTHNIQTNLIDPSGYVIATNIQKIEGSTFDYELYGVGPEKTASYDDNGYFQTIFGRAPTLEERKFWNDTLYGMTETHVDGSMLLFGVEEGETPTASDKGYFQSVFGRAPTAEEITYWSGQIETLTNFDIDAQLFGTDRFSDAEADANGYFQAIFGRAPTEDERAYWRR
ncbi:MAG: hypothetical protein PHQ61_08200, partial [Candidatus Omnitrophica bacterium]|nr:hypothetical protein [Candidatus Omnitrophota bacterium]